MPGALLQPLRSMGAQPNSEADRLRAQMRRALLEYDPNAGFTDDAWSAAAGAFQLKAFAKGESLVRAGEAARYIYFIGSGLVRLYYETESGKQFNKSFAWENMFVAGSLNPGPKIDAGSRPNGEARENEYGVEALEPALALAVNLKDFGRLLAGDTRWRRFQEAYIRWLADRKARRERQLLLESAEERYRGFLKDFPDAVVRIPQYHIALYLGITDVALSRIKKRAGI